MKEHTDCLPLSTIERYACMVTQSDPDLMSESNAKDRMSIIGHATMLVMVTIVAVLAWSAFWASFLPVEAAIPLGMLVGAIIFGFDQAVGSSDWELAGVLSDENKQNKPKIWLKLLVRVAVAFLLARATAVGATMWLFRSSIDNQIRDERVIKLAPLEADYAQAKANLKSRMISQLEAEMALIQAERETLNASLKASIAERDAAQQRASVARVEADRQAKGGLKGYIKGRGPLYEEAVRQQIEAGRVLSSADFNELQARARIDALTKRLDKLRVDLGVASKSFEEREAKLDVAKTHDSRWQPEESDPVMRYVALDAIKKSPDRGEAATTITWLMTLVLMTFELMFLLVKVYFNQASVYTVRLIARTKLEAAEVSSEYDSKLQNIKRNRPRGNLHIVGGKSAESEQKEAESQHGDPKR